MAYYVEGLTNVHGGESNVRRIGEYETLEEAIEVAKSVIDEFLRTRFASAMTIADLFLLYQKFGEVPFIFSDNERTMNVSGFNHFNYAMVQCTAICIDASGKRAS